MLLWWMLFNITAITGLINSHSLLWDAFATFEIIEGLWRDLCDFLMYPYFYHYLPRKNIPIEPPPLVHMMGITIEYNNLIYKLDGAPSHFSLSELESKVSPEMSWAPLAFFMWTYRMAKSIPSKQHHWKIFKGALLMNFVNSSHCYFYNI